MIRDGMETGTIRDGRETGTIRDGRETGTIRDGMDAGTIRDGIETGRTQLTSSDAGSGCSNAAGENDDCSSGRSSSSSDRGSSSSSMGSNISSNNSFIKKKNICLSEKHNSAASEHFEDFPSSSAIVNSSYAPSDHEHQIGMNSSSLVSLDEDIIGYGEMSYDVVAMLQTDLQYL